MIRYPELRITLILFALSLLTACNNQLSKQDTIQTDIVDIEKLASIAYEQNDWVESEKHYSELVRRIPETALYWFRLGNVYTRTQRPDTAIIAYREALVRNPQMAKAWYNMGVLQLKQALNSFEQLQVYVEKDDPLHKQSEALFRGIIDLINGNNNESNSVEQNTTTDEIVGSTEPVTENKDDDENTEQE